MKWEKGVVSIISPCYNREKILYRFLDSILVQTYKKIQVIMIDDGSEDNTVHVLESYIDKFKKAGISYEYHLKNNGGVSSAINEGLKYVKGEFLCWPDSDDWYEPESIKKRVDFLNLHPEFAIVSNDASAILADGKTVFRSSAAGNTQVKFEPNQFNLLLEGNSMICCICHMVRTEAFFATHPDGKIFNSRYGQNIQMLLPVYYRYKRGFIDEILAHYLVLETSLSHENNSFEKEIAYRENIEKLTIATLKSIEMPTDEREKYIYLCHIRNTRRRLKLADKYHNKLYAKKQVKELIRFRELKGRDLLMYIKAVSKNILLGGNAKQIELGHYSFGHGGINYA